MPSFGRLPDAGQESLNLVLARLDEHFPVGILCARFVGGIRTLPHVGDDRRRGRKFQPSLLQKLLDEELDFFFQ